MCYFNLFRHSIVCYTLQKYRADSTTRQFTVVCRVITPEMTYKVSSGTLSLYTLTASSHT